MQTLQNANATFLHLLQSFAVLLSERPDGAELDDKDTSQCDDELRTLRSVQKALERRISLVSRRRNTFPQINTLPPELLINILTLSLNSHEGMVSSNHATLSLVCEYWNRLVDTTPSLWAKIRAVGMSATKIVRALEKSRNAPLELAFIPCRFKKTKRDAVLNELFRHAHRWRKVSLTLGTTHQGLDVITTSSMPLLEYLSLSIEGYYRWGSPKPLDLFGGRAPPKLRTLCLRGIPVPWSPTILCHLTMLSISRIQNLGPSLDQLVTVLSTCPDLKSLSILEVTFTSGACTSTPNPMHMPALATLALFKLPTAITNRLLAFTHAPNCISGELDCVIQGDPFQTLFTSDVSHFFDQICSNPSAAEITCDPDMFKISRIGSWNITLHVENITFVKDTLTWLSSPSPIRMTIRALDTPLADVLAVIADMGTLCEIHFGYDVSVSDALTLLATCGSAEVGTPSRWPFPGLVEMTTERFTVDDDWEKWLRMLQRRQGAPATQDHVQHPKPLRKLQFGSDTYYPPVNDPVITDFSSTYWPDRLEEVRRLLGPGGELIWHGRVVTQEGVLEDRVVSQN